MKKLFILIGLFTLVNTSRAQASMATVEHPGFREYIRNSEGTYEIGCNTLITAVCYTTESADSRFSTSINMNTYNGLITPSMNINLVANQVVNVNIDIKAKYTYISDPGTPYTITHVFVLE